jgi:hypothetical protein
MRNGLILLGVLAIVALAEEASAQRRQATRYSPPYGPTISPYLQYYNRRIGVFSNYYTFVRPEVQLRSTLRNQQQELTNLDAELRAAEASRIRESGVAPTGTGSVYMNYLHYYPQGPR